MHALPSAQVAQGKEYFEDIHEGSQAQIVFTLIGEPPFTFTYQRSERPARKGAKPGKVLETHTVSGVMTHEYSIYSALEGTLYSNSYACLSSGSLIGMTLQVLGQSPSYRTSIVVIPPPSQTPWRIR